MPRLALLLLAVAAAWCMVPRGGVEAQTFELPGTQPATSGFPASAKIQHEFVPPVGAGGPAGLLPCTNCHAGSDTQQARPMRSWEGSMMSQAGRDFLFYAQLDLVNSDSGVRPEIAGMADMCLRCHAPVGWLEGRSTPDPTGRGFIQKDLFGVQCHACHRLVDPLLATSDPGHMDVTNILDGLLSPGPGIPPTFGNGMFVMDPKHTRRGPYLKAQMTGHGSEVVGEGLDWTAVNTMGTLHPAMNSAFHRSGNVCGTCHDVSNPADCLPTFDGPNTQKCFPIERTWTEWRHSAFFARGEAGSCQSCHMSGPLNGVGFGAPCEGGSELGHLNDIHFHDLTGGNAFMPEVIKNIKSRYESGLHPNVVTAVNTLYPPPSAGGASNLLTNVNVTALDQGVARVRRTLKRSAFLQITGATATDLTVRVTNRTGHKLPTGYPEGRRMWLNTRFVGPSGSLVAESGRYQSSTGSLFHDQNLDGAAGPKSYDVVRYTDAAGAALAIGRPTKVWEARLEHQGTGTEFHFALNDHIRMDNRIPPEGWNAVAYTDNRASPVIPAVYTTNGWQTDYTGGNHYDEFSYPLPAGVDRVELILQYQTASREYIEALDDDNPGTLTAGGYNRGSLLAEAWSLTGRSAPVVMRRLVHAVVDTDLDGLSDGWETNALGANPLNGANDDPDGDRLSNAQEFQQGSDPLDPNSPIAGTPRRPVDIVMVLDTSGSMNDAAPGTSIPKIQTLKEAATLFLETWKDYASPDDRIGVVYFGTDAVQFGTGALLKNFFAELNNVRMDIQGRSAVGWTAMGGGSYLGIQGLGAFDPASPRNRHLILFSNGMQNRSPMIVPFAEIPEFLVMQNQTPAENPDVTGPSNVTIPAPGWAGFPDAAGSLVRVHSVGIGVAQNTGGTAWHDVLRNLAVQQQGKHNFITRASELEGVFLEDLVESLKGNTLAYVLQEERTLAARGEQVFEFPVNRSASKFTVAVSWAGQPGPGPALELVRPDGVAENVDPITRSGTFYRLVTRHLDDFDDDAGQYGNWKLRAFWAQKGPRLEAVAGPAGRDLLLRVHALLDDRDLQYKFTVPASRFRVGQPLRVTAMATQRDQFLKMMDRVTVTLRTPGAAVGAELARSRHRLGDVSTLDPDLVATPFARKLFAAFSDAGFRGRFAGRETVYNLEDGGANGDDAAADGIFSRTLLTPEVPGHYALRFRMAGHTLDGQPFTREESHSVFAQIGKIDPGRSSIHRVETDGRMYVTLTPRDSRGNLLGPGYTSLIDFRTGGVDLPVEDLLDGRYRAPLPPGFNPNEPVRARLSGEEFFNGPVPRASVFKRIPWWLWLLLLLLLLVLLVLYVLRRP